MDSDPNATTRLSLSIGSTKPSLVYTQIRWQLMHVSNVLYRGLWSEKTKSANNAWKLSRRTYQTMNNLLLLLSSTRLQYRTLNVSLLPSPHSKASSRPPRKNNQATGSTATQQQHCPNVRDASSWLRCVCSQRTMLEAASQMRQSHPKSKSKAKDEEY